MGTHEAVAVARAVEKSRKALDSLRDVAAGPRDNTTSNGEMVAGEEEAVGGQSLASVIADDRTRHGNTSDRHEDR